MTSMPRFPVRVFAVKSRRPEVRARCTSGGVFWELASACIAKGGVVYGCAFDVNLVARHVRCETIAEVESCMGSKYSQSDMGDSIKLLIADLKDGRDVVFTGTPCQVAGVRAVSGDWGEHLLLVDLVCHGVPSPALFQQHLGNMEEARGKKVVGYDHRPKNKGWGEYLEIAEYDDGSTEQATRLSGVWREIFYANVALRPSCYKCPYGLDRRPGDITIGDFWGIEEAVSDFRDSAGVSLVIANTETGMRYFSELDVEYAETTSDCAAAGNPNLGRPSFRPSYRDDVWDEFWAKGFRETVNHRRYLISPLRHAYRKSKPLLRKLGLKV